MTDEATIPVVNVDEAKEKAYDDAYARFDEIAGEETEDFTLEYYRDGATYANTILPMIRALAGYADAGHGTYQQNREVAAVGEHQIDDLPMDAERTEATYLQDEILEAWEHGAYDAAEGEDRYATLDF